MTIVPPARKILLPTFFMLLMIFCGCDRVKSYTSKALQFVGLEKSNQTSDKKKSTDKKETQGKTTKQGLLSDTDTNKVKQNVATDNQTPLPKIEDKNKKNDIVVTRSDDKSKNAQATDIKTAVAPEFKVEAPVVVTKRIGGVAQFIDADDVYVYMDFPQHFAIYDKELNLLVIKPIKFPLVKIHRYVIEGHTYLYLKEQNDVLEIFELLHGGEGPTPYSLQNITSKELKKPFFFVDTNLVAVCDADKVQFLDLTDSSNAKIIFETPIGNVNDVFTAGDFIYLAHDQSLEILDQKNFNQLASLRIGKKFKFVGTTNENGKIKLCLGALGEDDALTGLQFLNLKNDFSGIEDVAQSITLETALNDFSIDLKSGLIIGQTTTQDGDGPIALFSLKEKRLLRGSLSSETKLITWSFYNSDLYLVNDKEVSIKRVFVDDKVIAQSGSLQKILQNKASTPLAQIGATKIVRDEYTLTTIKHIEFMADARKIILLDKDHFLVFENTFDEKSYKIFATTAFSKDGFILSEPTITELTKYTKLLHSDIGLLAYSQQTSHIYLIDANLDKVQQLPITVNDLVSWDIFSTQSGMVLMLASPVVAKIKIKSDTASSYAIQFYSLTSPKNAQLITTINSTDKPFVFYVPANQILVMSKSKMLLYDWLKLGQSSPVDVNSPTNTVKKNAKVTPKTIEVPPEETVAFEGITYDFVSAKLGPNFDRIFGLFQDNDNSPNIVVFNLLDTTLSTVIEDIDITPEQFEGSSFSKEGRLFILPSNVGTLFFDATHTEEVKEIEPHWPIPSYYIDVADQGRTICVALGYIGVYCGELQF